MKNRIYTYAADRAEALFAASKLLSEVNAAYLVTFRAKYAASAAYARRVRRTDILNLQANFWNAIAKLFS